MFVTEPAFGVYVHWPFCAQKCPYCDFNSHVRHGGWDEPKFLEAYKSELSHVAKLAPGRTVTSIFFGGGTPSLMKPTTTAAILDHIAMVWPVADTAEITLEANPNSVEAERFAGYKSAGVNRVSVGVQSLRDDELRKLGRLHSVAEAKTAIGIAQRTFDRVSFDLIYARSGHTPAEWRGELAEGLAMAGDHLSLYQLTIEPDTPFQKLFDAGKLTVPDAPTSSDLYDVTQELTEAAGLPAYETSNHARPGEESRHNLLYWRYGEYAGIGPGAHGRLMISGTRHATVTERNPEQWAERVGEFGHGFVEQSHLAQSEAADEVLLMGLRLNEGVDLGHLARIGGVRPSHKAITWLSGLGMVEQLSPSRLRAIGRGRFVLNEIVRQLSASFEPVD